MRWRRLRSQQRLSMEDGSFPVMSRPGEGPLDKAPKRTARTLLKTLACASPAGGYCSSRRHNFEWDGVYTDEPSRDDKTSPHSIDSGRPQQVTGKVDTSLVSSNTNQLSSIAEETPSQAEEDFHSVKKVESSYDSNLFVLGSEIAYGEERREAAKQKLLLMNKNDGNENYTSEETDTSCTALSDDVLLETMSISAETGGTEEESDKTEILPPLAGDGKSVSCDDPKGRVDQGASVSDGEKVTNGKLYIASLGVKTLAIKDNARAEFNQADKIHAEEKDVRLSDGDILALWKNGSPGQKENTVSQKGTHFRAKQELDINFETENGARSSERNILENQDFIPFDRTETLLPQKDTGADTNDGDRIDVEKNRARDKLETQKCVSIDQKETLREMTSADKSENEIKEGTSGAVDRRLHKKEISAPQKFTPAQENGGNVIDSREKNSSKDSGRDVLVNGKSKSLDQYPFEVIEAARSSMMNKLNSLDSASVSISNGEHFSDFGVDDDNYSDLMSRIERFDGVLKAQKALSEEETANNFTVEDSATEDPFGAVSQSDKESLTESSTYVSFSSLAVTKMTEIHTEAENISPTRPSGGLTRQPFFWRSHPNVIFTSYGPHTRRGVLSPTRRGLARNGDTSNVDIDVPDFVDPATVRDALFPSEGAAAQTRSIIPPFLNDLSRKRQQAVTENQGHPLNQQSPAFEEGMGLRECSVRSQDERNTKRVADNSESFASSYRDELSMSRNGTQGPPSSDLSSWVNFPSLPTEPKSRD